MNMAKNYFGRYVWLIDTINRHGHITLADISRQWQRSALNEDGSPLAERTFHNHREAILDTFDIEIKCDRSLGYYIANSEDMEGDSIRQWLLESLSMNNLLNESRDLRNRILFEEIPSSRKWIPVIVNAMHDGKAVEITYQSFWKDDPATFTVHPYCLKLFKQRWYLLGRSENHEQPRIYALDERMTEIRQLSKKSVVPKKFDAKEFFQNHFGIIVDSAAKPSIVEIKVVKHQVRYIESLPLHSSQNCIQETPEYHIYRFHLVPTYDFRQEILRWGPNVEVLYPASFRDEIKDDIARMYKNYGL